MIVYRGQSAEYNSISPNNFVWVSDNRDYANIYGYVRTYEIDSNLNILHTESNYTIWESLVDLFDNNIESEELFYNPTQEFVDFLSEKGYDGFRNDDNILIFDIKELKPIKNESKYLIKNFILEYIAENSNIKKYLGNTFQIQHSTAEITVGKQKDKWGLGGVYRERIENAGDILRELSSRGNKPDYRYIIEKINKIESWMEEDFVEIPNNITTLDQFNNSKLKWTNATDSREFVVRFYSSILNKTILEYENIPTYCDETKTAKDMVLNLLYGNWDELRNNIYKIKDIIDKLKTNGYIEFTDSMNEGNNKRISNHYFLKNLENAYHVFKNKELHYELFENLENSYDKLKNLNNVVIAYRVLNVDSENDINLDRLGKHFTTDYDSAISDDFLEKIGVIDYQGYYNYDRFYLITIETNINNVDVVKTIDNNINFPDEEEINFKNENEIKITSIKEIDI